jgi:predicted GTPase
VSEESDALKAIAEAVQRLEEMLAFLPDGVAKDLRLKIATLRGIILEQRPPAFVLIGRRGAGKSSLINALFGAKVAEVGHVKSQTGRGKWFDYKGEGGTLAILDTRGVQEGSTPEEADEARTAIQSIVLEVRKKAPDVILFLVKATEIDAAIDGDLDALEKVLDDVHHEHKIKPPVIAIATHCDILEPKDTRLHKQDEEPRADVDEKLIRVSEVERLLEKKLRSRHMVGPHFVKAIGISSYLSFKGDGSLRSDARWRVDELTRLLYKHMPDAGRGMLVRIARVQALQEELAITLTRATAALCAGIAAVPIPIADVIPLTAVQVSLIAGIAWISGRPLSQKVAAEFLTSMGINIGAGFALREAARAIIKFVFPGAGVAVSGAIAFAGTMAIGAAARAYFIRKEPLEKAKEAFENARKEEK